MKSIRSGGGWPAIRYVFSKARQAGGFRKLYKAMRSKNACKTCALGMGGQRGGMVNEAGRFPEVCKKSVQAMVADMQGAVSPELFATYSADDLRALTPRELEGCGRLTQPLYYSRNDGHYRPISWDEAIEKVVAKLCDLLPSESFWYFSGRSSNEAGFLLQLFARLYGTNNINNCSYYCHQASGVGLTSSVGTGTATIVLDDVEHADCVFVIGGNPASNHPRLMRTLMDVRRRGGEVIVINPVIETGLVNFRVPSDLRSLIFGSEIASLYVQPHIGGDLALLHGIAKRIVELGAADEQFLAEHCVGWEEWKGSLADLSWEEIERKSGVTSAEIEGIAQRYAKSRNAVFSWTMGITHHAHGVQNVQAIANLALLRGMAGRPRAGLMPIRGHSNVQGIGSVGVTPKLKEAIFQNLENRFGVKLPTEPGMDTMACMEAADTGKLRFGFCLGGNLYGSNPDSAFAGEALSKLEMLVHLNTTLNTGHVHGLAEETLILPVLARDEEPEPTTQESMFNFVRLSDGGPRRHVGPRSEIELISTIANRLLNGQNGLDWEALSRTGSIRDMIAAVVPGFEKIAAIDQSKEEFHIAGRTLHEPLFPTNDGRARVYVHKLQALAGDDGELRLMTVRSEGQFNTVVYEEYDLYRGQDSRDVILLHPRDLEKHRLADGQAVTVTSKAGELTGIRAISFDRIKAGNCLMYYPEANRLVVRDVDPASRTPAFKGTTVRVVPAQETASTPLLSPQRSVRPTVPLKSC